MLSVQVVQEPTVGEALERIQVGPSGLVLALLVGVFALFTLVRVFKYGHLRMLTRGFLNPFSSIIEREELLRFSPVNLLLDLSFVVTVALLLLPFVPAPFHRVDVVLLLVASWLLLKVLLVAFFMRMFFGAGLNVHLREVLLMNKLLPLLLAPLLLAYYYGDQWQHVVLLLALGVMLLGGIYRLFRIYIKLRSHYPYGTFYSFTYLCALEIAPYILILKGFEG